MLFQSSDIRQVPKTIRIVAAKIITPIQPNDIYITYPNTYIKPKAPNINNIAPILLSVFIFYLIICLNVCVRFTCFSCLPIYKDDSQIIITNIR